MLRLRSIPASRHLLIACWLSYAVTTIAKMSVPTVIASMVSEGFLNKSQSGLLSGIFYLVYGIGQLIFGKYFNRHSPYIGVKLALFGSALCCILMSFTTNFYLLLVIWCLCAAFNAGYFPATMKILSTYLVGRHSVWARKYYSLGYQFGYIICFAAGSAIIDLFGWIKLYYFAAILSVATLLYWCYAEYGARKNQATLPKTTVPMPTAAGEATLQKQSLTVYFGTGIFCLFAVAFLNTLLNQGVKTWTPTIVMDIYHTSPSFSTLLNVAVVVMNFLFLLVINMVLTPGKIKPLPWLILITIPLMVLMHFTDIFNEYWYIIMLGVITSVMSYQSSLITVQIPYNFKAYNDVSRICGIMNMCSSFGILISSYAYGLLAEHFGWFFIMDIWVIIAVVIIVLVSVAIPMWRKFVRTAHDDYPVK